MKLLISMFVAGLLLTGCASQPDYHQAKNGGFGYSQSQLSDTQYRIHFKARGDDKAKAMDYAMLRAAEVTLEAGYNWFTVNHQDTLVDQEEAQSSPEFGFSQRYARVTECGAISCRTALYPTSQFSSGIFVGGTQQSEIESVLQITLGRGEKPADGNSYDASQVQKYLQPQPEPQPE